MLRTQINIYKLRFVGHLFTVEGCSKDHERGMPLYMNLKHALATLPLVADAKLKLPLRSFVAKHRLRQRVLNFIYRASLFLTLSNQPNMVKSGKHAYKNLSLDQMRFTISVCEDIKNALVLLFGYYYAL
jgi:hypothetical protein